MSEMLTSEGGAVVYVSVVTADEKLPLIVSRPEGVCKFSNHFSGYSGYAYQDIA